MDSAQAAPINNNNLPISNNDSCLRKNSSATSMQASKPSQESQATLAAKGECDRISETNDRLDGTENDTSKSVNELENSAMGVRDSDTKETEEENNESSTLSTAFTISFQDESPNSKKLFGIRDSIRKFAPPKPHTIEKPRPSKSGSQENSFMSIESAPGGYAKQSFHRGSAAHTSCRSSSRKSDSSRHSNISESAAFLIEKMLNCKQAESLSSIGLDDKSKSSSQISKPKGSSGKKKLATRSSDDILDDEIDFCEDKSDNGTYIVGADPESDAARKKIDELFGVVKAAEASIIAEGHARNNPRPLATVTRQSRLADKKPLPRERQQHLNRLATVRTSSRSSSSSRQEMASSTSRKQQSNNRHSRNSSCDRASKLPSSRPRRAASQSSRQSSGKDLSDGDTQSSRSSLHNDNIDTNNSDLQLNPPSMKFNRAFALRRARLGLGEPMQPGRFTSTPTSNCLSQESDSLNISPRRAINRYGQPSSSGQSNLGRTDGGRYSLRMKNPPAPNRLITRISGQQNALIDNYASKISSSKTAQQNSSYASNQTSPIHQSLGHHTSISMPYQSGDELEISNPMRHRDLRSSTAHSRTEIDPDIDYNLRYNYSLNLGTENYSTSDNNTRACASAGKRVSGPNQLGALDCLVISAISSLSVKIRSSVCDLMVEHAKRLPPGNETRSVVEEILPQLTASSSRPRSPTSIEEIDQSLYFDLAQALKNLKKVEQIIDVMKLISNQIQPNSTTPASSSTHTTISRSYTHQQATSTSKQLEGSNSNTNSESNSLSPV